jgi:hypothetical protein
MKILLILAIAVAAAGLPGCVVHGRSGRSVGIVPVVVVESHSHTHGPGCGHVFISGSWVVRN